MDNICEDMASSGLDNFNILCFAPNRFMIPVFNGKDYVLYAGKNLRFVINLPEKQVVSIDLISYLNKSDYTINVSGPNNIHAYILKANKYNSTTNNYIFNKGYNSLSIDYNCNRSSKDACIPMQYYKIHVSRVGIAKTYTLIENLPIVVLTVLLIILLWLLFRLNNNDSKNRPT